MDANKIYKKHLKEVMKGKGYQSPKQIEQLKYEATINAIDEVIKMLK